MRNIILTMEREFRNKEGFNREDSGSRNEGWSRESRPAEGKDKRPRIRKAVNTLSERKSEPYFRPRPSRQAGDSEDKRRSFNPNFDKDNRLREPREDSPRRQYDSNREYSRPFRENNRESNRERRSENNDDDRFNRYDSGRPAYRKPGERSGDRRFSKGRDNRNNKQSFPKGGFDSEYKPESYPTFSAAPIVEPIRLNKYISMSGVCSRREADDLITKGEITVNGKVVTELGSRVNPNDVVCHNGAELQGEKNVYILMNKPKGFVTTVDDPNADRTVMDIVKNACKERVYPVGRLDKNSVGVLIITNDGELTKKLTHPSHKKKKIYQVALNKAISLEDMQKLCDGVELEDGLAEADEVKYVKDNKTEVGISIHSGKNRIVRRMFEAIGYHVQKLDRVYMAGLTKKGLRRGAWRYLTPKEVAILKSGNYE